MLRGGPLLHIPGTVQVQESALHPFRSGAGSGMVNEQPDVAACSSFNVVPQDTKHRQDYF